MSSGTNPTRRGSGRNLFCPRYSGCLDRAVKERWKRWGCSDCGRQFDKAPGVQGPLTSRVDPTYPLVLPDETEEEEETGT